MNSLFDKGYIKAVASVVPKNVVSLDTLYEKESKYRKKIIHTTGIENIRVADKDKTTVDYCINAANLLFKHDIIKKENIDGIVLVTQTGDYIMPASSVILQDRLGLRTDIVAFDINYGCSGYIYGLLQAFMLIETGICNNVLLCVGDTISKYINPNDKSVKMVMGDAASATIVSKSFEINKTDFIFYTNGAGFKDLIIPAGGNRSPHIPGITDKCESDEYGNVRCQENLYMNGLEIMNFSLEVVPILVNSILKKLSIRKEDIGLYCLHQANKFIVERLIKKLKIDSEKTPIFLNNIGNTGSASIPVLLSGISDISRYDLAKVLLCGFGVGLSAGVAITNMSRTIILPIKEM